MQTNLPYGIDDLPLIIKLYSIQLKKAYRVTYRSAHTGKEDFVGAHNKEEAERKRKEIENFGHKVQHIKVLKAKVYIENLSEAPEGVKIQEGERGGHFYENEERPSENMHEEISHIKNYNELKSSKYFKGSDSTYDNYKFNNIEVKIKSEDIPDEVVDKTNVCNTAFDFFKLKQIPTILFPGKRQQYEVMWSDREGNKHRSYAMGTANYKDNNIKIWDNYHPKDVINHEVGHFVFHQLLNIPPPVDLSIIEISDVDRIEDYNNTIEIFRKHNVNISFELMENILSDIIYIKNLGLIEPLQDVGITYYDHGYSVFEAIQNRLRDNKPLDLTKEEIESWKKYRNDLKNEANTDKLRNEWINIWQQEGYEENKYANRNHDECFAEFYQMITKLLIRLPEDSKARQLIFSSIIERHPKKYEFFKKYVLPEWLP